jgi:peptidoglycan-N-acetylglucosamine deacetylase
MKVLFFVIFLIHPMVFSKEIALTFDDSPRHATGYFNGPTRAKKLIENLEKHKSGKVVFFSVSGNIDEEGEKRLKGYANAGHIIANHTTTHPDFNKVSLKEYQKDFLKAHGTLSSFKTYHKLFRFPYLREGNTILKRDGMRNLLEKRGYQNAYITANNYDWYIERLFQKSVLSDPNFSFDKMRKFYVSVLMESIIYYDKMAIKHIGRSPKHEMDISALFIGDLILKLRKNGWKIISLAEALKDEISNYKSKSIMPYNPGRIGEIAKDHGQSSGLWHETCNEGYLDNRFKKEVSTFIH